MASHPDNSTHFVARCGCQGSLRCYSCCPLECRDVPRHGWRQLLYINVQREDLHEPTAHAGQFSPTTNDFMLPVTWNQLFPGVDPEKAGVFARKMEDDNGS